jgi:hypothetical protein
LSLLLFPVRLFLPPLYIFLWLGPYAHPYCMFCLVYVCIP